MQDITEDLKDVTILLDEKNRIERDIEKYEPAIVDYMLKQDITEYTHNGYKFHLERNEELIPVYRPLVAALGERVNEFIKDVGTNEKGETLCEVVNEQQMFLDFPNIKAEAYRTKLEWSIIIEKLENQEGTDVQG
jgi:hypothetical protein